VAVGGVVLGGGLYILGTLALGIKEVRELARILFLRVTKKYR
jgi:hypothetical protein